jgi:hypothetical protein
LLRCTVGGLRSVDANSLEKSCDGGICHGREDYDAVVSMQDLVDSYLPPFQACVERGKSAGLMCSCTYEPSVPAAHRACTVPSVYVR